MNNTKIVHLNDDNFDSIVLKANTIILVDFWAEWCGPCKMIAPILEEIAEEYSNEITVAKLNIDDNPITTPKYDIRGVPTLILFKDGKIITTKVGSLSKAQLKKIIRTHLNK